MNLILGTAQLARPYGILEGRSEAEAMASSRSILEEARHCGTRMVDTAPAYGLAEEILGESGITFEIHTKLDLSLPPKQSLVRSAEKLSPSAIKVVYFHQEYLGTGEQLDFLAWVSEGPFHAVEVGVSIYSEDEFWRALEQPLITVMQIPFSFLDRRFGKALQEEAVGHGKTLFARSIFHQGLLSRDAINVPCLDDTVVLAVDQFRSVARDCGLSPAQAAMGWVRQHHLLSGIVVGATSASEWADSVSIFMESEASLACPGLEEIPLPAWTEIDPRRWTGP